MKENSRWARLEELFATAEPLSAARRAALLAESFAAAPDPELQAELEEMLAAAEQETVEERMVGMISRRAADLAASEPAPRLLGPYKIRGEIGRGGMATVYEAVRADQAFERTVAVKVLRRGMDTADIVRRLRRERQILANLDHPNIARLLDGGSTADGRPFVVMELIAGEPIDVYCRRQGLDLRTRLQLFRQVCGAVHHAHRNLVLHRDIKPSNILVGAEGVPKLLDFGIAKLLHGDGDERQPGDATLTGVRLLTPAWASPEQVRGFPLSTASDVYSLGLLLYLLVAGRRAYELDRVAAGDLERVVCELEPPGPGHGDDLDLVVMAALRKEPERRYASAEQLSEEVRRYLENLPVAARKDTFGYRAGKFVRRHRWGVATAAAVFLALLGAALVTRHQALEARAQKERAERMVAFLSEVYETADPSRALGEKLTARDMLDQGVARLRDSLPDDPEQRADLQGTIGRAYLGLGLYPEARALFKEALALRGGITAPGSAAASSLRDLAAVENAVGRYVAARALAAAALEKGRQAGDRPLEIAKSLALIAEIELVLERLPEAEAYFLEALELRRRRLGPLSAEVADIDNGLGELYYQQRALDPARRHLEQALAHRRRALRPGHPDIATSVNNLAALELLQGHPDRALPPLEEMLETRRRIYGNEHGYVAVSLNNLATAEAAMNLLPAARGHLQEALAINRQVFGEQHIAVADNLHNLAKFHQLLGEAGKARELHEEALQMRRRLLGPDHTKVAESLRSYAELHEDTDLPRAEELLSQALAIERRTRPPRASVIADTLDRLGLLAWRRGALDRAEDQLRAAVEVRRLAMPKDWQRAQSEVWLGRVVDLRGRSGEALGLLEPGWRELAALLGEEDPQAREAFGFLEQCRRRKAGAAATEEEEEGPGSRAGISGSRRW